MTKEKNDLNQELKSLEIMFCTYKEIKDCGHYQQCNAPVNKDKMDKANFNNNYCVVHQKFVDEINKKRKEEANNKLKENIIKYVDNELKNVDQFLQENKNNEHGFGWKECLTELKNRLNNGDLDGNE